MREVLDYDDDVWEAPRPKSRSRQDLHRGGEPTHIGAPMKRSYAVARTPSPVLMPRTPERRQVRSSLWQSLGALAWRKRASVSLMALAGIWVGLVSVNALVLQKQSHPAPLFQTPRYAAASSSGPVLPPARPSEIDGAARLEPTTHVTTGSTSAPSRDAIGDILKASDKTKPSPPPASPLPSVLAAQRALNKLGYGPLRTDGLPGPGTRQAIERFERDRKLPVSGELSSKTLQELSALSGVMPE